ncbi:scarecrow-like protein 6 [Aristolochia californica]|uniref:scarecrow-like protein 6 n=1 Tax=Aristolochia californica TaxID=171875 RepID=UPI0035DF5EC2
MRAVPFSLPGKGVLDVTEISAAVSTAKWKKEGLEPTSVLDTRRSPSPPTSTSTLSSSLGGSTDTAGVAAVSDNPPHKWPPSQHQEDVSGAGNTTDSGSRKEEWASDLQPIPSSLEIGGEKCSTLGMDDWENMLAASTSSPGHDPNFFRWFIGDIEDPSTGLKNLLQTGGGLAEFESGGQPAPAFGLIDPGFGYETGAAINPTLNVNASFHPASSAADFVPLIGNGGKLVSAPTSAACALPNYKVPFVGGNNNSNNHTSPMFSSPANNLPINLPVPLSLPPGLFYQQQHHHHQQQQLEPVEEKPQLFNPHHLINQQQVHPPQNPSFLLPLQYGQQEQHLIFPPQPKRHHTGILEPNIQIPKTPFADSGQDIFLRRHQPPQQTQQQQQQQQQSFPHLLVPHHLQQRPSKPKVGDEAAVAQQQQQQAIVDQLLKAAELVETGNSVHAQGILARLNHQLSSPVGKPLFRAAFYFKEALRLLLDPTTTPTPSPLDVVFKISAYKVFSEISPFLQFANFTSNQALLEALEGYSQIHVVDFDIGLGGQWASFMQEIALKRNGVPSLKITAFASPSSHDPLELGLTRENLTHFAADLNISFEFNVINLDSFDPSSALLNLSDNEAVAVNFPVGPTSPSVPSLLRLVKQLNPKIVVSVDRGSDRSDVPFSLHFLSALKSYSILLDSLDAVNVNSEAVQKIERYLLKPRIETAVAARHRAGEKNLPWRNLFASAGFSPVPFSNFTETQAECVVKRVRGFQVEKHQASLCLFWQRGELVSVSAWRC